MFTHRQDHQFKSKVEEPHAVYARRPEESLRGRYGEIILAMHYMFQGWTCTYRAGILTSRSTGLRGKPVAAPTLPLARYGGTVDRNLLADFSANRDDPDVHLLLSCLRARTPYRNRACRTAVDRLAEHDSTVIICRPDQFPQYPSRSPRRSARSRLVERWMRSRRCLVDAGGWPGRCRRHQHRPPEAVPTHRHYDDRYACQALPQPGVRAKKSGLPRVYLRWEGTEPASGRRACRDTEEVRRLAGARPEIRSDQTGLGIVEELT